MIKEYKTPEEYRAFVEGAYSVINKVMGLACQQWGFGRDSLDLDSIRDLLITLQEEAADSVVAAHKLENDPYSGCTCYGARDHGLSQCQVHGDLHPYWDNVDY